jgi:hypothetical protein
MREYQARDIATAFRVGTAGKAAVAGTRSIILAALARETIGRHVGASWSDGPIGSAMLADPALDRLVINDDALSPWPDKYLCRAFE